MADQMSTDTVGNVALDESCENTQVINELKVPVAVLGARDLVVVASQDGILVTDKNQSARVKEVAAAFASRPMLDVYKRQVHEGAQQAVDDINKALGFTGDEKVQLNYDAPGDGDIAEQIDIIDQMLDKSPDALIIGFVDINSGKTQLELADSNGVPVFAVDSGIENSLIISESKTDNYQAGKEAAVRLCELIGDEGQIALLVHSSRCV